MVRTQIQLTEEQVRAVKRKLLSQPLSVAERISGDEVILKPLREEPSLTSYTSKLNYSTAALLSRKN